MYEGGKLEMKKVAIIGTNHHFKHLFSIHCLNEITAGVALDWIEPLLGFELCVVVARAFQFSKRLPDETRFSRFFHPRLSSVFVYLENKIRQA